MALSIVIPAHDEAPNLRVLLPQLQTILDGLGVESEVLVVVRDDDPAKAAMATAATPSSHHIGPRAEPVSSSNPVTLWIWADSRRAMFRATRPTDNVPAPTQSMRACVGLPTCSSTYQAATMPTMARGMLR